MLIHCWWDCKLYSHYGKEYGVSSIKVKTELPYDPAILLMCIYPKKIKTRYSRVRCTPMFTTALLTTVKMETT